MPTPAFEVYTYVVIGLALGDGDFEGLTQQFARATASLRQRDPRYEVSIVSDEETYKVHIAASSEQEAKVIWAGIERELKRLNGGQQRKPRAANIEHGRARIVILEALAGGTPLTVGTIAADSGIQPMTIRKAMDACIRDGLVKEMGKTKPNARVRRPAALYGLADEAQ
jgi:hypothetical protein